MSSYVDLGFGGPICLVDVETTGLDPDVDRIVSVAAYRTNFNEHISAFEKGRVPGDMLAFVVDPEYPIHPKASAVHGFKNKDLKGKPVFADIATELREFVGTRTLVGHNVSFDKRFLNAEFKRAGEKTLSRNRSACTMAGIENLMAHVGRYGQKWERLSLDRAAALFLHEGRKSIKHDAQEDVHLTTQLAVFLHLLSKIPKRRAKAEIRVLVESWPEESARRKEFGIFPSPASAQASGCGTIAIILLFLLFTLFVISGARLIPYANFVLQVT